MSERLVLIPTLGRGPEKQKTWSNLPPRVRAITKLVVSKAEAKEFRVLPTLICPEQGGVGGLGAVRQWCLQYAQRNGATALALLDDDLITWSGRGLSNWGTGLDAHGNPSHHIRGDGYLKIGPEKVGWIFDRMWRHLRKYAHAGIGHRQFANSRKALAYNQRLMRALFYRTDILKTAKAKFDTRTMSDFDMTLKLLRAGYANIQDNEVVQEHNGSNLAGGCSLYRDAAEVERSARELHRRYDPYVALVERPGAPWGIDGMRVDVRVKWAKLAKDSGARTL